MGRKRKSRSYDVDDFTEVEMQTFSYNTWGHIPPCALLVDLIANDKIDMTEDIKNTLDCLGYLTPAGEADVDTANYEIEQHRKESRDAQKS